MDGPALPSGDGDAIHPAQPEAAAGGCRAERRPGLQALEDEALGAPDLRAYDRRVIADGIVRRASDRPGLADVHELADAELDRVRFVRRLRLLLRGGPEGNERRERGQVSSGLLHEHEPIIAAFESVRSPAGRLAVESSMMARRCWNRRHDCPIGRHTAGVIEQALESCGALARHMQVAGGMTPIPIVAAVLALSPALKAADG